MWSLVQYRRIRKEVQTQSSASPSRFRSNSSFRQDAEQNRSQDAEPGTSDRSAAQFSSTKTTNGHGEASSTTDNGPAKDKRILVECTSDTDPLDPRNWPLVSRAKAVAILSLLVFVQTWAGSSDSLANSKASREFHVSNVAENLSTAMYLFGVGSGCLLVGPLSETVGRNAIYLGFSFTYLLFVLGTALSRSFASQIICRFFVGLASSGTLGINGASVRDMFRPVKRSFWFPAIAWVNVVPPVIAPIVGGWVASRQDLDWRWMEWITLIISTFAFVLAFFFLPETYLPLLLDWKAKHLRKITGDDRYVSKHAQQSGLLKRVKKTLPLSIKFTTTEPAIMTLGGFLVLLYILLFSFLSGFDYVFKHRYNLSSLGEGACFASIASGATAFTFCAPGLYEWTRHHTENVRGAPVNPEFRLWPAIVTAPLLPISLFWLGWTNYARISIWSGLGACFCFGIALNAIYVSSYEYIIDSYSDHAAIALASITMMRYLIAGGMVIAARPMYEGIGVHWTMTLLGCVAAVLAPGPFLLRKFGKQLRKKSPYAQTDAGEHMTKGQ